MKLKKWRLLSALILLICCLSGCSSPKDGQEERKEVDFTVVEERKRPEQLLQTIEENKKNEMRMTYEDGETLYLIRGYGEQKTGGYSIAVSECTEDEGTVYFDTQLIGPSNQDRLTKDPSFPYIAVMIEMREKNIQIE